jgi:hypothetical protein
MDKHFSLFCLTISDKENNINIMGQCYKKFYDRKLRLFILS